MANKGRHSRASGNPVSIYFRMPVYTGMTMQGGKMVVFRAVVLTIVAIAVMLSFSPADAAATDWSPVINRLAADGFDRGAVNALFSRWEVSYEPDIMAMKISAMIKRRHAQPGPVFTKSRRVHRHYLKPQIINEARLFAKDRDAVLNDIAATYCVPKEVVVSIMVVETRLGRHLGRRNTFNVLASMALSSELNMIRPYISKKLLTPDNEEFAQDRCRQKSEWAYNELKALIRHAEGNGIDPLQINGSVYGAIGLCQFMPSNISLYGIDGDRDGRIDLFTKTDALYSIANYLNKKGGWTCGIGREDQRRAIYSYNHSRVYVETVLAIADKIKTPKKLAARTRRS
jgi:membrane-bound lytic murein transglycosylase B